jgi:alpha-glucosidase
MYRKILNLVTVLPLLMAVHSNAQVKSSYRIYSPDKKTCLEISVKNSRKLQYRVTYHDKEITKWSTMGLVVNGITAGEHTQVLGAAQTSHTETFAWPLGENDKISNNYQQLALKCRSGDLLFNIKARVFDGTAAFRYEILAQKEIKTGVITKELTEFNLTKAYTMYQFNQESIFKPYLLDSLNVSCDFPATLVLKNQQYLSIGESDNHNYIKGELIKGNSSNSLAIAFNTVPYHIDRVASSKDTIVKFSGDFDTPWRTISASQTAIGLHDYSQLNLKLVAPVAAKVPENIKPGKLIRAQLNTRSGLDCIDFAVKHDFQYIMFDAGWYGPERSPQSDPTVVIPAIDMPKIIQHSKEKGIGVILYVNYVGLKLYLDKLLPVFKNWGISGIKFGFVDGLSQQGISFLDTAINKVTANGLILDIHDNYKPTGLSRKYPALLTQEGIRGDENSPDAFHTTVLPFTRFIAGPADFTFCYPNPKNTFSKNLKVSKAQQLALTVVYFSPLQSIFWYGQPNDYTNEDEIEFFKYVPTVWNETHYLAGEIAENISVARRKGNTWYIGNVAGLSDWHTAIKLNFLTKDKTYTATIYEDDDNNGIRKRIVDVKKGDNFPVDIKAKGGQAIIIRNK